MTSDPDEHAFERCAYCHGVKAHRDIIYCDEKPICKEGDCRDKFYEATRPRPRRFSLLDDGHC